jgi:hypothetical protein
MYLMLPHADDVGAREAFDFGVVTASVGVGILGGALALSFADTVVREELAVERATAFATYNASLEALLAAAEGTPDAGPPAGMKGTEVPDAQ